MVRKTAWGSLELFRRAKKNRHHWRESRGIFRGEYIRKEKVRE
jgi:hypothetical protein